jgi:hypothetical protein
MQDIGGKEDTELNGEDLRLCSREFPVESLGHCQSVGLSCGNVASAIFFCLLIPKLESRRTQKHAALIQSCSLSSKLIKAVSSRRFCPILSIF